MFKLDDVFILCIQGLFNWSEHLLPEMAHSYLLVPPNPNQRYNPGNVKIRSSPGKAVSKTPLSNGFYSSVYSPTAPPNTRRFLNNAKFPHRMSSASNVLCSHILFLNINLNSSFPPNHNPCKWSLPMLSQKKLNVGHLFIPRVLMPCPSYVSLNSLINKDVYRRVCKNRHFMVYRKKSSYLCSQKPATELNFVVQSHSGITSWKGLNILFRYKRVLL